MPTGRYARPVRASPPPYREDPCPAPPCVSAPCARPPAAWSSPSTTARSPAPAATATTCSARASSAPRAPPSRRWTPTPTGCAPRSSASTGNCARPPGRRPSTPSPPDCAASSNGTARTRSASSSATPTSTPWWRPLPALLVGGLGTHSLFTASTVDQMPKHVSSGLLYGDANLIPVPDLDRTDHLLLIGANPLESNGSLCTAPDFGQAQGAQGTRRHPHRRRPAPHPHRPPRRPAPRRPPRHRRAAARRDRPHPPRRGPRRPRRRRPAHRGRRRTLRRPRLHPEAVADACDVDADVIRTLARELAAAPTAAVYARIGSCTVPHGTLASWLVDVLNALTGNLDRPGGALFPQAATDKTPRPAGPGRGFALGRWHSRVGRHPEAKGELPLSALAEEIDTPTEEGAPVRAVVAVGANPVLSAPDGDRLDKALASSTSW